jgi:two-component system, chemotaxis family, CheB/CheR fusion protein
MARKKQSGTRKASRRPVAPGRRVPRRKGPPSAASSTSDKLSLVVGIGASAGGLEAFTRFFANMPANSGMAFVLIQHLDPERASMLVELLSAKTSMPVNAAADGLPVTANSLFVIPPNAVLTISEGVLRLSRPAPAREYSPPSRYIFREPCRGSG